RTWSLVLCPAVWPTGAVVGENATKRRVIRHSCREGGFTVIKDCRTAYRVRRWVAGLSLAGAALAAAAVPGLAAAHADDAAELLGQAGADLIQANQVVSQVPVASLDFLQADILSRQEVIQAGPAAALLNNAATFQDALPVADQTSPLLLAVDNQVVQAYAGLLEADQGFLAAAQAGDLAHGLTASLADLSLIDANLATLGADFDVTLTDWVAMIDPGILTLF